MYKVYLAMDKHWVLQYKNPDWTNVMLYVTSLGDILLKTKQLKIVYQEPIQKE